MAKKSTPRKTSPRRRRLPAAASASTAPVKSEGIDNDGKLEEATLRRFVFQTFGRARRTQDSPVMPDVWLRYIRVTESFVRARIYPGRDKPPQPADILIDLLLTPWSGVRPGRLAKNLREELKRATGEKQAAALLKSARIALTDSRVVLCADLKTLVRHVVPLSNWWRGFFLKKRAGQEDEKLSFDKVYKQIEEDLEKADKPSGPNIELSRYAALVGFIRVLQTIKTEDELRKLAALAYRLGPPPTGDDTEPEQAPGSLTAEQKKLLLRLYEQAKAILCLDQDQPAAGQRDHRSDQRTADEKGVYLINLNRPAAQSLFESRATVKADAAHRLFDINTTGIAFAVIDGGIDATHPAFLRWTDPDAEKWNGDGRQGDGLKYSRVLETYDFTLVRDIVAHAVDDADITGTNSNAIKRIFAEMKRKQKEENQQDLLEHLKIRCDSARDLDWEILAPLIRVPHVRPANADKPDPATEYRVPGTDHGTHVAGILGADLRNDPDTGKHLEGMCPHISLHDLRVFDKNGNGDEFSILCAIEFVGWLNRDRANPVVHGVNLSLALAHDVDSFACGQTPICEACNHLCGAGTVVVAAAGNTGFEGAGPQARSMGSGYRPISITDPGNAEYVLTVGSTHRRDPHLYGVSYFSARGPTGDGRRKPDLLAPGEKITSTIRGGGSQRMDGTSMAAPHVAGAAALLMARHPELIGHPARIKEILMKTATDLNRETSFQGAGLVDVLRALQSV
jgi:subtilisin family serine protease